MRAFVYTRQSSDKTGAGAAVSRQLEDCQALCERRGYDVVEAFQDNDVSASSGKVRPQYRRMVEGIKAGRADVAVVWDLDRLTRRPIEVEEWMTLNEEYGVNLVTIGENVDLATDNGRMFLRIKIAVARAEIERKGARQKRAQQQAAQQGKPAGGRRAFGYEKDGVTVNAPEAVAVRKGYTRLIEGGSLKAIAREWNEAGFRTTMSNPWERTAVRNCLNNPRYAGLRAYRGEVVGPATWPALVDEQTYETAHALLSLATRRTTMGTARKYLLPGLTFCGICGSDMTTGHTRHGRRVYVCRAAKHISRSAPPIDALIAGGEIEGVTVRGLVVERLSRDDARDLLSDRKDPEADTHKKTAYAIRKRLDDLAVGLEEGLLSLDAVRTSSKRLRVELGEVEARMHNATHADVLGPLVTSDDIWEAWQGYDLQQRRAVIDALMKITLLSPKRGRNRFDPETVVIDWRSEYESTT